jgi:CBS-domain-containing membrane protein
MPLASLAATPPFACWGWNAPSAILEEIHWPRVLAAALSLAATGSLMILFRVVHPPAGATTLIVSLGFITTPTHLLVIEIAVALMALQARAVNRLAGIDYPLSGRSGFLHRVHRSDPRDFRQDFLPWSIPGLMACCGVVG